MAPGQYSMDAKQHTLSPIVTGATVIGMKFNGGVLVAADTLASYGSEARYKDVCRIAKVGEYALLGASGELSDFQYLTDQLDELADEDWLHEDGCSMGPKEYSSYIGRVMYNRRSKMNPLYNQFVVVGKKKDEAPHLLYVDHQGTAYSENYVATGFGMHLAMPIIRNEWRADMSFDEAKALTIKCLQVCFYRDCRAYFKIRIGKCTGDEATISEPIAMDHFWGHTAWTEKRLEDTG
eukprot:CAMPEP_0197649214 /NCGR_PEP_ID=MMETSP1338-20131121/28220_1 /TAXON_ID=43686 ORGANISM="Pelagodinium beii, Strain RCC1491" /NCGR_SAMPLE_ID=MMETSP1338 /ASSEMBLY_ACC=CAM_ASM_000754 /LENGTH=235 /DNA_ID=CAMNT_0043223349 /DNA_START=82 /DNA_END=785 /DNA_ORIENTATION=+